MSIGFPVFLILILNKNLRFLLRKHRDSRCPFVAKSHKSLLMQFLTHLRCYKKL